MRPPTEFGAVGLFLAEPLAGGAQLLDLGPCFPRPTAGPTGYQQLPSVLPGRRSAAGAAVAAFAAFAVASHSTIRFSNSFASLSSIIPRFGFCS